MMLCVPYVVLPAIGRQRISGALSRVPGLPVTPGPPGNQMTSEKDPNSYLCIEPLMQRQIRRYNKKTKFSNKHTA